MSMQIYPYVLGDSILIKTSFLDCVGYDTPAATSTTTKLHLS